MLNWHTHTHTSLCYLLPDTLLCNWLCVFLFVFTVFNHRTLQPFLLCLFRSLRLDMTPGHSKYTREDKQNKMCLAGMSYIMSLTSSLTSAYLYLHTHSLGVTYKGVPYAGGHTPSHIPLETFPVKATSLLRLKEITGKGYVFHFIKRSEHCFLSDLLLPLILLVCQIVYGYCEDCVVMEMFCLAWNYIFSPLSQKSSHCFQLAVSAWRVSA